MIVVPKHCKEINAHFQINTHSRNAGQKIPDLGNQYQTQKRENGFKP
jgi:hypothetical protein